MTIRLDLLGITGLVATSDFAAKAVAIMALVGDERTHRWGERLLPTTFPSIGKPNPEIHPPWGQEMGRLSFELPIVAGLFFAAYPRMSSGNCAGATTWRYATYCAASQDFVERHGGHDGGS
jgi:hypothetical protein